MARYIKSLDEHRTIRLNESVEDRGLEPHSQWREHIDQGIADNRLAFDRTDYGFLGRQQSGMHGHGNLENYRSSYFGAIDEFPRADNQAITGLKSGRWDAYRPADGGYIDTLNSNRGKGPKSFKRSDLRLREIICDRFMEDPYLDASDIEVNVKDCEVTLAGSVANRTDRRHAEEILDNVPGILHVDNCLRINRQ